MFLLMHDCLHSTHPAPPYLVKYRIHVYFFTTLEYHVTFLLRLKIGPTMGRLLKQSLDAVLQKHGLNRFQSGMPECVSLLYHNKCETGI